MAAQYGLREEREKQLLYTAGDAGRGEPISDSVGLATANQRPLRLAL